MQPYGFKRTYSKCRVLRVRCGTPTRIAVHVKNRKRDRSAEVNMDEFYIR